MIKFPKIYRSITESSLFKRVGKSFKLTSEAKLVLLVFTAILFLLVFLMIAMDLRLTWLEKEKLDKERQVLTDQIQFWQAVSDKFPDYRDSYFQIALLEYRLRDFDKSREFLNKSLELDPNFKEGRDLEKLLN